MNEKHFSISTEFIPCGDRRLFALLLEPTGQVSRGGVLFLPPFAEEMHRSRRMVAQQARALAVAGYTVMVLDVSGCGDSSGLFRDATWCAWKEDSEHVAAKLAQKVGEPVCLWGLRTGALLACDVAQNNSSVQRLLLWQPTLNGEQYIDQFLRLELAGRALKGEEGFDRAGLWKILHSGTSLDVAGYELSSQLALEVSKVRLGGICPDCSVIWLDINSIQSNAPANASARVLERWKAGGTSVYWSSVTGSPFWRNVDAEENSGLINETLERMIGDG